ncbi:hypothetical protein BKA60DRAFT_586132 [Fusarium oxysporum]|nr:hypothetical protein BKA60DRAFT_586132 [Fusarium oxysporum]
MLFICSFLLRLVSAQNCRCQQDTSSVNHCTTSIAPKLARNSAHPKEIALLVLVDVLCISIRTLKTLSLLSSGLH